MVFTRHNIINDTPFIKLDLVSCRNILIYLNSTAQNLVLNNLLYALNQSGILFLGSSESLGDMTGYFNVLDSKWKFFQNKVKQRTWPNYTGEHILTNTIKIPATKELLSNAELKNKEQQESLFHRYLSNQFAPSCIFF
jgi:two-component system CheB/CheR fusion protein